MDKVDLIRSQVGVDWSKEIVEGAAFEDLDPEAVSYKIEFKRLFDLENNEEARGEIK